MTDDRLYQLWETETSPEAIPELVFAFGLAALFWAVLAAVFWAGWTGVSPFPAFAGGAVALNAIWAAFVYGLPRLSEKTRGDFPLYHRRALIAPTVLVVMPALVASAYLLGHWLPH